MRVGDVGVSQAYFFMISRDIIFQVDPFWGARTADARTHSIRFQHLSMDKPTRALATDKMQGVLRGKQSFLEVQDRCYLWWKRGWRVPCCRDDGFWARLKVSGQVRAS